MPRERSLQHMSRWKMLYMAAEGFFLFNHMPSNFQPIFKFHSLHKPTGKPLNHSPRKYNHYRSLYALPHILLYHLRAKNCLLVVRWGLQCHPQIRTRVERSVAVVHTAPAANNPQNRYWRSKRSIGSRRYGGGGGSGDGGSCYSKFICIHFVPIYNSAKCIPSLAHWFMACPEKKFGCLNLGDHR